MQCCLWPVSYWCYGLCHVLYVPYHVAYGVCSVVCIIPYCFLWNIVLFMGSAVLLMGYGMLFVAYPVLFMCYAIHLVHLLCCAIDTIHNVVLEMFFSNYKCKGF